MDTRCEYKEEILSYYEKAKIYLSEKERARLEITDFGLGNFRVVGLSLVTYINNDLYCAKEMVLLPGQICPQHRHPPVGGSDGKCETFRCRWGTVYLYVPGDLDVEPQKKRLAPGDLPEQYAAYLTSDKEIILKPGEQYTIEANTPHWFMGGPEGAVVSEFSSTSDDATDIFDDPRVIR